MSTGPALLDTDTLSELSRGHSIIQAHARAYLTRFGRLTITSVTVFERLRGYRLAIRRGRPYERHLQAFEALVANCVVLPLDSDAGDIAASIWSRATRRQRTQLGDIFIAAIALSRSLPVVTRNRDDFERLSKASGHDLPLLDWSKASGQSIRLAP